MKFILFGSNNPSGAAFLELCQQQQPEVWGRKSTLGKAHRHIYCDLADLSKEQIRPLQGVVVSFAPIWLLAPFLANLLDQQPAAVTELVGIIACSSSSFLTKRFAFNRFDKELADKLEKSHRIIRDFSQKLNIPSIVLAPTMIYGQVGSYGDKNLKRILSTMRKSPFILLPQTCGLRQPIHATQLAAVAHHQAKLICSADRQKKEQHVVLLGGDTTLTYREMILNLQKAMDAQDKARQCRIWCIPDQFFLILAAPILPFNPRLFETIMRIKSDLSGFDAAHQILDQPRKDFPVLPLAK